MSFARMSDRKDDLLRQLGTMWRMASSGLGTLKEVVVRSTESGRLRVDVALLAREKQQLLESLGRQVLALVDAGKLEVPPGIEAICEQVRRTDARLQAESARAHDNAYGAPRGFEPEAGDFLGDDDAAAAAEADELDEHAQVAHDSGRHRR
jgi:hypothetical protein